MAKQVNTSVKAEQDPEVASEGTPVESDSQETPTNVDEPVLNEVESAEDGGTAQKAASHPAPPSFPDGGFTAWLQCAGSFFMFFNSWGVVNSFGQYLYSLVTEFLLNADHQAFSRLSIKKYIYLMCHHPTYHG